MRRHLFPMAAVTLAAFLAVAAGVVYLHYSAGAAGSHDQWQATIAAQVIETHAEQQRAAAAQLAATQHAAGQRAAAEQAATRFAASLVKDLDAWTTKERTLAPEDLARAALRVEVYDAPAGASGYVVLTVTNTSGKTIAGFSGRLSVVNMFGTPITTGEKVEVTTTLAVRDSGTWHVALRNGAATDGAKKVGWAPWCVVFADGTTAGMYCDGRTP